MLDLGRLYINKTELQNAVDACALAAAPYLDCDPNVAGSCPSDGSNLKNAENAGVFAAGKNFSDFQNNPVSVGNNLLTVSFSAEFVSGYAPPGTPNPASKYVKCTAESQGIVAWFMGVLGVTKASIVRASAVAILGPGQTFCSAAPMGLCQTGVPTIGGWASFVFQTDKDSDDDITVDPDSQFRWVDFDPNADGTNELRDRLAGTNQVCGLKKNDPVKETGGKQGVKSAYNTRFGLYRKNDYTPQTAPPDETGYAYPNKDPGSPIINIGDSAYADYRQRQQANDLSKRPFIPGEYPNGNKVAGDPTDQNNYRDYGQKRRLVPVPVIDCTTVHTKIIDMACVLMLNPMNKGAGKQTVYLEYRGLASNSPDAECQSFGLPGDSTSAGMKVPMLVQ